MAAIILKCWLDHFLTDFFKVSILCLILTLNDFKLTVVGIICHPFLWRPEVRGLKRHCCVLLMLTPWQPHTKTTLFCCEVLQDCHLEAVQAAVVAHDQLLVILQGVNVAVGHQHGANDISLWKNTDGGRGGHRVRGFGEALSSRGRQVWTGHFIFDWLSDSDLPLWSSSCWWSTQRCPFLGESWKSQKLDSLSSRLYSNVLHLRGQYFDFTYSDFFF